MAINNELKLKALKITEYLTSRYNKEFSNIGNNYSKLNFEEAFNGRGYLITFESKHIYFDIQIIPELKSKYETAYKHIVGTYYFKLLDDKTSKNEYYVVFLKLLKDLFNRQKINEELYGICPDSTIFINQKLNEFNQINKSV